jgi:hypothetical protein
MADFRQSRLPTSVLLNIKKRERIWDVAASPNPLTADKIIPALPSMMLEETGAWWRAAIAEIQDRNPPFPRKRELERLIENICEEWTRRYRTLPRLSKRINDNIEDDDDLETSSASKLERQSPLRVVGYTVNAFDAYSDRLRAGMLDRLLFSTLPPVGSAMYMRTWGMNGSEKRYQRIVGHIEGAARRARANDPDRFAEAIAKWEADLKYLRKR